MRLATPESAILSAVIFNALIIVALIPLALRGVRYRPLGAAAVLRRNLLVYGLGGIVVPFIGIKLIDLLLVALRLVVTEIEPCSRICRTALVLLASCSRCITGVVYPLARDRHRAGRVPAPGQRQPGR